MTDRRSLLSLVIGLAVCLLLWQIYTLEQSIIATEAGLLNFKFKFQAQNQYQQQQPEEQQQQQSFSFSSTASNVYTSLSGANTVSGSIHTAHLNDANGNMTTPTNSTNNTNYFTNSSSTNRNYNLSLIEDFPRDDISNLTDLYNTEIMLNQTNEQIIDPSNSINIANYFTNRTLTNSNYNLSLHKALCDISNLTDFQDFETNQTNENLTTPTNLINNTKHFKNSYLTNSNYNISPNTYPYSALNYEVLPKDDISTLIDLQNFEYIINQKACCGASPSSSLSPLLPGINNISTSSSNFSTEANTDPGSLLLLILVPSAPENYEKRSIIRETWGSPANTTNNIRLIFLLGAVHETKDQQNLENENQIYSDIVQGNFIDAYRNMTYKHVMALKWFTYYCPNAKYILKMDDDVFANTPKLIDYINTVADRHNLLFCQEQNGAPVYRNESKWSVSEKEYPEDYYPPYCPGYSILYSSDVAFRLYLEAQKTPYFWIDDVHITGTLAQQANITITSFIPFLLSTDALENILAGKTDINANPFLFVWPSITPDQIRKLWKLVENLR